MIQAIKVTTETGVETIMELRRPNNSGLLIREVSGLGSGSTDLKLTELATLPGSVYTGEKKPTRNIIFDLIIMWKNTVEEARHACELAFPIGQEIRITFISETRNCYCTGIVESNEPDIFNDEGLDGIPCQVSVVCADPRFFDIQSTIVTSYQSSRGGYVFPIKKPSSTMGIIEDAHAIINVTYDGTKDEGMIFEFDFKPGALVHRIRLSSRLDNNESNMLIQLLPKYEDTLFRNGDKLIINTRQGEKAITLIRNNKKFNYLNYLDAMETTSWCYLRHGQNKFNIIMNGGTSSAVKYAVDVSYLKTYWSV